MECKVNGCSEEVYCKGFCKKCYSKDAYQKNKELKKAKSAEYRDKNKEYLKEKKKN